MGLLRGGNYQWTWPRVTAGNGDQRPTIADTTAPDPVTGSTTVTVTAGTGPAFTTLDRVRLHYIQQSWDGKTVLHDSWQHPGQPEAVPTGVLGNKILAALLRAHQGDVIELVVPAASGAGVNGQSAVVVFRIDQV